MKYKFHIEEILSKDVIVEAETRLDARVAVEERIKNTEIVLNSDDFSGCRIIEDVEEESNMMSQLEEAEMIQNSTQKI